MNAGRQADELVAVTIVGAGPGLGLAIARRFGREGARLALIARTPGNLDRLVADLSAHGVTAAGFPADIAEPHQLTAALSAARERFGDPAVLIFNPSVTVEGKPTEIDYDDLVQAFRIGVASLLVAVDAVVPAMRAAGHGTVLVTGSGLALRPFAPMSAIAVQKAAVRSLALSLAAELAPAGIHVATVTIQGVISRGTDFEPDLIAEHYWRLHQQLADSWESEVRFTGGR
jgi:short-subunit dehydrogenase